jgi:hypothetical protein
MKNVFIAYGVVVYIVCIIFTGWVASQKNVVSVHGFYLALVFRPVRVLI